jgi:hypothetical protein
MNGDLLINESSHTTAPKYPRNISSVLVERRGADSCPGRKGDVIGRIFNVAGRSLDTLIPSKTTGGADGGRTSSGGSRIGSLRIVNVGVPTPGDSSKISIPQSLDR